MSDDAPDLLAAASADRPLVLTGPPSRLTGKLPLHNAGDERVVVRGAGLRDPSGQLLDPQKPSTLPTLVLRPFQSRTLPLLLALNPTTPAGEYHIELDLAGHSRSVLLHVTEVFSLSVRPDRLVLANRPGKTQHKQVVITNTGNVPFTVADIGEVALKDDLALARAIHITVEPRAGDAGVNIDKIVVDVLDEIRRRGERVGSVDIRLPAGETEVPPGDTAVVDLDITIAQGLPQSGRYRGLAPLLTQDLEILVVQSGQARHDQPARAPREDSPKTGRRARKRPQGSQDETPR